MPVSPGAGMSGLGMLAQVLSGVVLAADGSPAWARQARAGTLVLGVLLLGAFLSVTYLPMVDLPQHTAQISLWARLAEPAVASEFAVNLRTPYVTAYALARLVGEWIGVHLALKLIVWASVLAHALAFAALVRRLGHPEWLGLIGIPLACGYAFHFGFVGFLAGTPLVLLAVVVALDHAEQPSRRRGAALAGLLAGTLATHGFAFGIALVFVLPLLARGSRGSVVHRLAPLVAPLLLWAVWFAPARSVRSIGATLWEPRLLELAGAPALFLASSAADRSALVLGYVALALVGLALGKASSRRERWAPLVLLVLGFCLFPGMMSGFGPLHPRFAGFFVPALLLCFEPRRRVRREAPGLAAAFVMGWVTLFFSRLARFEKETAPMAAFIVEMPPGLDIRPIVFDRDSAAFPGLPAHLHLSAYYLAEKGGRQGYSFAMYPTSVVRYVSDAQVRMGGGAEWHPEWFSAASELDEYDCFLVKSSVDRTASLFGERAGEVALAFRRGDLWAYERRVAPLRPGES